MDFVGGFLRITRGHDYLFMVLDGFNKFFFLWVVRRPSKDINIQSCSLKGSGCTLGLRG
jgi:hypothetical protein